MTVFLVSSSNPGIKAQWWSINANSISAAFNSSAQVTSWHQATDNVWFVQAKEGTTARDLRILASNAPGVELRRGPKGEELVVALNKCDEYSFYSTSSKATKDWLERHLAEDAAVSRTRPAPRA